LTRAIEHRAIEERCARPLGLDPVTAAHGIVEIANAAMVNALRLVSVQRGYDSRNFVLIAFGGAGPLHANRLAAELAIPTTLVPLGPGITSARGLLVTDLKHDYSTTLIQRADRLDCPEAGTERDPRRASEQVEPQDAGVPDCPERIQETPNCVDIAWHVARIDGVGDQGQPVPDQKNRGREEEDSIAPPLLEVRLGDQSMHAAGNDDADPDEDLGSSGPSRLSNNLLFSVSGPPDLQLREVRIAADEIRAAADPNANVIFGASFSEPIGEDVLITLIATGMNGHRAAAADRPRPNLNDSVTRVAESKRRSSQPAAVAVEADALGVPPAAPEPVAAIAEPVPPETPSPSFDVDVDEYEVPSFLRRRRPPASR